MAKIRVYELARDLNLTNKDLLEKLKEIEVIANSHMSSLDEDIVSKIKNSLLGKKGSNLEETRIRPTVIRRRRRAARSDKKLEEHEIESEEEIASQDEGITEHPEEETVEFQEEIQTSEESHHDKKVKTPEQLLKPKRDEKSAKIISKPVVEVPVEEEKIPPEAKVKELKEDTIKPEKADQPPAHMDIPEKTMAKEAKSKPKVQETELKKAEEIKDMPLSEPTDKEPVIPAEKVEKKEKPKAKTTAKSLPKSKKSKKETPAKIIKLPVPPKIVVKDKKADEKSVRPSTPRDEIKSKPKPKLKPKSPQTPVEEKTDAAKAAKGKDKWKKGKKRRPAEENSEPDKKFLSKKVTFRKKEVIESDALYSGKGRGRKKRRGGKAGATPVAQKPQITQAKAIKRRIKIDDTIILSELAKRMGIKANEMIAKLMRMDVMATVNQTIDFETAVLVASEFEYEVERASFEEDSILKKKVDTPEKLQQRPPVVTIMGHVDHGKTSLLDVIRKTRVTDSEAGGITQHIGAYHVETKKGHIVFLDTPGHEAFSAMRSRGAKVTDIVVLVVAADDGIMPQTVEAINHSKAAGVPIIVAINKMDKAGADPERVQRQLSEVGLVSEDWGGETIFVKVSAKMDEGINDLLEMILLQAEVMELKANPDKLGVGHVVEAKLDSGRGPVATVLVYDGTLKTGDPVVCGLHYGKVRALLNDHGKHVQSAGPSIPVEIVGLSGVPMAGDEFVALADEKDAKQVSLHRIQKQRAKQLAKTSRLSLDKLYEKMKEGEVKDLNLIVKTDVEGSIEALKDTLTKLSNEEVNIRIIQSATGTITETDIYLAAVSNAIIIGFNVRANQKVQDLANEEHVDIRYYNVIYNVIKEIKSAIVGLMESTYEERVLGRADVRETFHIPKIGAIAGSYVTDGKIERGKNLRLIRDGIVVYEGKCGSLRRFKDDTKEVNSGYECGIGIENFNDIKVKDVIECYYLEEIKPNLE